MPRTPKTPVDALNAAPTKSVVVNTADRGLEIPTL